MERDRPLSEGWRRRKGRQFFLPRVVISVCRVEARVVLPRLRGSRLFSWKLLRWQLFSAGDFPPKGTSPFGTTYGLSGFYATRARMRRSEKRLAICVRVPSTYGGLVRGEAQPFCALNELLKLFVLRKLVWWLNCQIPWAQPI